MRRLATALLLVALAAPAHGRTLEARYVATWAGLPAGQITMRLEDDGSTYRGRLDMKTEGLPRWFTRFKGSAVSEGRLAPDGTAHPLRYDALYDLRKRKNKLNSLRFVATPEGVVAERGPGDTSKKPPIDEQFRRGVVDPLSALIAVRHRIQTGRLGADGRFVVPVFDGSRRFDAEGRVARRDGRVHVDLLLKPIAGFREDKPDEDEDPEDTPRPVEIEFTDDAALLPVRLEVSIAWFPAVVRLGS